MPSITGAGSLDLSAPIINTVWITGGVSGKSISATVILKGILLAKKPKFYPEEIKRKD